MAYADVSVVWEGALDQEVIKHTDKQVDAFVNKLAKQVGTDHVQVYVVWHDHPESMECECVQYLTDHRPYMEWNAEEGDYEHA